MRAWYLSVTIAVAILLAACGGILPGDDASIAADAGGVVARVGDDGGPGPDGAFAASIDASLKDVDGGVWRRANAILAGSASASVTAIENSAGLNVSIVVTSAPPGLHGVHIREARACDESASHWNPDGTSHGFPTEADHHFGDLGNITVQVDGTGTLTVEILRAHLGTLSDPRSATGRAISLASQADDGSDPTGNTGASISCGVIELE